MTRDFKFRKRLILGALALVVALDAGLTLVSWRLSTTGGSPAQELNLLAGQLKLLKADIERTRQIRVRMPADQQDCDAFEQSLPSIAAGYSSVLGDIGNLAKKSGLQTETMTFHQKDISDRRLSEVEVTATVSGDYAGVVRFINGLQRAGNLYVVDELSLASATQSPAGPVRVNLHLKTYFRS